MLARSPYEIPATCGRSARPGVVRASGSRTDLAPPCSRRDGTGSMPRPQNPAGIGPDSSHSPSQDRERIRARFRPSEGRDGTRVTVARSSRSAMAPSSTWRGTGMPRTQSMLPMPGLKTAVPSGRKAWGEPSTPRRRPSCQSATTLAAVAAAVEGVQEAAPGPGRSRRPGRPGSAGSTGRAGRGRRPGGRPRRSGPRPWPRPAPRPPSAPPWPAAGSMARSRAAAARSGPARAGSAPGSPGSGSPTTCRAR